MIIWIASYPKSGNTWIRSLLSSYLFSSNGEFSFDLLENIKQFSSRDFSSELKNKELDNQNQIFSNWLPSQRLINKDKKIHILKTHNAMCNINGNNFTDEFNTSAVIYIVRDPRNLITSLAHHYELNLDEAFKFLTNERKIIFPLDENTRNENNKLKDLNFISSWSTHYISWKNIKFCPIKIIKYEDFVIDTEKTFISILLFLKKFYQLNIDNRKVERSIFSTSFNSLKSLEDKEGFKESVTSQKTKKKIKFFNLGKDNDWKKMLDKSMALKIENSFKNTMRELKYLK